MSPADPPPIDNPRAHFVADGPPVQLVERGQDYARHQTIQKFTNQLGEISFATNAFRILENNLHYFDSQEWKVSEDLIESFPDGAIARRGPAKAIFSHDLNVEAAFDIETGGRRVRGGLRAIQLTDLVSGNTLVLGTVKNKALGQLLPPNQIAFIDCMDGLAADLVLEWKHNQFSHDVVLREQPRLPQDWKPDQVRLEIVTELLVDADPELRSRSVQEEGQPELQDDVVIHFGSLAMIQGKAFPVAEDRAFVLGAPNSSPEGTPVLKQWHRTKDGRRFVVESVSWAEIAPQLKDLPVAQHINHNLPAKREVALAQTRFKPSASLREPMQIAGVPYRPKGYVLDFIIVPELQQPAVFTPKETYIVRTAYYIGTSATFEPGCLIKRYANNGGTIVLYGTFGFPDTLQSCVFTSIDDDSFGEKFPGWSNPYIPASDGNPADNVYDDALKIWYVNSPTEVRCALLKWAHTGIEYWSTGSSASHTVRNCRFENITVSAISVHIDPTRAVTFTGSEKCSVPADSYVSQGSAIGSLSVPPYCTEKAFAALRQDIAISVPDTMGAVGPNHFVMLVNRTIAIFDKSNGNKIESTNAPAFFGGGATMADPRIVYDHQAGRWVAVMMDRPASEIKLAVSRGSDPTGLFNSSKWDKKTLNAAASGHIIDYPTLGADKNGYYVAVWLFNRSTNAPNPYISWMTKIFPIRKPTNGGALLDSHIKPVINVNQGVVTTNGITNGFTYPRFIAQPAVSFDTNIAAGAFAWFIGKGAPTSSGGPFIYGRLQWDVNGNASCATNWSASQISVPDAYYDLDLNPVFPLPQKTPPPPETNPLIIRDVGSRLMNAVIRNGFLWTTHHVGLDQGDPVYNNGTVDRTGCGWYRIKIKADNTLSLSPVDGAISGRIYDAGSNPYFYHYPSIAVNSQEDMVIGFSGSRTNEYIGAFYSGRRNSGGLMPTRPVLVQAGRDFFGYAFWGDYSYTSLDPDGLAFWTIQEYAELSGGGGLDPFYGLWITKVKLNP